jgi:CDP-diacylglycerol--serine O-phosphatidyltransferase
VKQLKNNIPHAMTLANLTLGVAALVALLVHEDLYLAMGLVLCAAVLDVGDGWAARKLGVAGPLGVQLDSLADVVSFGVVPALALAWAATGLHTDWYMHWYALTALLIAPLSALRLARFNLDTRQTTHFIGLPTPANALWIFFWLWAGEEQAWLVQPWVLGILGLTSAFLLNSSLPLMGLKSGKAARKPWVIWMLASGAIFSAGGLAALAFLIPLYLVISLLLFKPATA